jgi:aerobic-type carbon monoxide dehydrogenase small subunit (CoxS/CutS family)
MCGTCKVAVQETTDGPFMPVLACFARMNALAGMYVITVEHLAALATHPAGGEDDALPLHPLQREFLRQFAFQCGYCTPGFLMAAFVLMDALRRRPVRREHLDSVIYQAFAGQLCRCTGYARYIDATRAVILAMPGSLLDAAVPPVLEPSGVCFRIVKRSGNDLSDKTVIGYFDSPRGEVILGGGAVNLENCRASLTIPIASVRTGEPIRDLNLRRFFFAAPEMRFEMTSLRMLDDRAPIGLVPGSRPLAVEVGGRLVFCDAVLRVTGELLATVLADERIHIVTRRPIEIDARDLKLPVSAFALEFGLKLLPQVEVSLDVVLPYRVVG